jgi:hypothetical protein
METPFVDVSVDGVSRRISTGTSGASAEAETSRYSFGFTARHDSGNLKPVPTGFYCSLSASLAEAKVAVDALLAQGSSTSLHKKTRTQATMEPAHEEALE